MKFVSSSRVELLNANADDKVSLRQLQKARSQQNGDPDIWGAWHNRVPELNHSTFMWKIQAPLFLWRDVWQYHLIESPNTENPRHQLPPIFYLPSRDRLISREVNGEMKLGTGSQQRTLRRTIKTMSRVSYWLYVRLLDAGLDEYVARFVLTRNIHITSTMTLTAAAQLNFITAWGKLTHDYYEVREIVRQMEQNVIASIPQTYKTYVELGRPLL